MAEEVEPSVRFCEYQLKRSGGAAPEAPDLAALGGDAEGEGGARGLLASKLAALQAEAQVQQSASTSSFEWRGQSHPVRHERVRVALHSARELEAALDAGAGGMEVDAPAAADEEDQQPGGGVEGRLAAFDKAVNALGAARAAVRALAKANAGGEGGGEGALDELSALEKALSGALLERTLQRGEEQVAHAEARFEAANARAATGKRGAARQERGAKPEDLLRMHEALMHHSEELGELASALGGRAGEALSDVAAARGAGYAAGRCYYVGHTYLAGGRAREAAALFGRCAEGRVPEATEKLGDLPKGETAARAALPRLAALTAKARAWQLVAAAEAAAEAAAAGEEARKGVAGLGLEQQAAASAGGRFLSEALDAWDSFGGTHSGRGARIAPAPYPLQPVAARPIMLDTAAAGVEYPSLAHRTRGKAAAEGGAAPSTFARLFGWGATS
ncbi:signal recognition particle subunit [Raphidocelis subcapitata]|uniref:Signal recognition particle subunit n=1 Tax=Raphidocelis subcapitata TaxID=307507 RepID=A0A2V0PL99_9CHLO|nr:signal recognition particle subunit [Raphidocelis subcapitata]|eukprot:GBF97795.1 signal recognition particle subunit [Raphidocelis subcapitata]